MKGMKGSPDEGGVRVPFFVRWDGKIKASRDIDLIAGHIDLYPTLAALAGADVPAEQVDGRSLLPLIENSEVLRWQGRYLFTHTGRWKTGVDPNLHKFKGCAVRSQRFRFVNNEMLFDMQSDPGQETNIIDKHPKVVAEMREAYDAWWDRTVPMMVNEKAPMSKTRPFHVLYQKQMESGGIPDWVAPSL